MHVHHARPLQLLWHTLHIVLAAHAEKNESGGARQAAIPGQLFQACQLSSAGNMHGLSGIPPLILTSCFQHLCQQMSYVQPL